MCAVTHSHTDFSSSFFFFLLFIRADRSSKTPESIKSNTCLEPMSTRKRLARGCVGSTKVNVISARKIQKKKKKGKIYKPTEHSAGCNALADKEAAEKDTEGIMGVEVEDMEGDTRLWRAREIMHNMCVPRFVCGRACLPNLLVGFDRQPRHLDTHVQNNTWGRHKIKHRLSFLIAAAWLFSVPVFFWP